MQFVKFLQINPEVLGASGKVSQPSSIQTGVLFAATNFNGMMRGGSIIDTILNTPSHTVQHGGHPSDINRLESKLSQDIKLYSGPLRSELLGVQNKLKAQGKEMASNDFALLSSAIDSIAKSEREVLSAVLAGHKFLEAHRAYELNQNLQDAAATLENIQKIVTLLDGKLLRLKQKNQQVAQTIVTFNPLILSSSIQGSN